MPSWQNQLLLLLNEKDLSQPDVQQQMQSLLYRWKNSFEGRPEEMRDWQVVCKMISQQYEQQNQLAEAFLLNNHSLNLPTDETYNYHSSTPNNGVNVYSFALHPEQHQPSGTCNLSRIDNTTIILNLWTDTPYADPARSPPPLSVVGPSSECYIYDTNYNVLRIMSGMGGLAYSN